MHFRFLVVVAVLFFSLETSGEWGFEHPGEPMGASESGGLAVDPISVRESTSELQVTVGQRLFVFGKARGTLDKVKIGMHVLPFSQAPEVQGNESTFNKVAWKKLRDGSIQVQASYHPWPAALTWTVFANGQLKMEASAPSPSGIEGDWLGLGFDYPEHQLYQVSWIGDGVPTPENHGNWKNGNFAPMADSEQGEDLEPHAFFQKIQSVKLEFESVVVDVRTETPGIYLGFGQAGNRDSAYPAITSDLGFLYHKSPVKSRPLTQTPDSTVPDRRPDSLTPLVLWFHFQ